MFFDIITLYLYSGFDSLMKYKDVLRRDTTSLCATDDIFNTRVNIDIRHDGKKYARLHNTRVASKRKLLIDDATYSSMF